MGLDPHRGIDATTIHRILYDEDVEDLARLGHRRDEYAEEASLNEEGQ
jgi:hypothetical protein